MKDVTGQEINDKDIIIFSKRDEKRQTVGFGIVVDCNHRYGNDFRIQVIPMSNKHARMGIFKVGYKLMSSGTPIVHLKDYQVFVVKEPATLPEGIADALLKAWELNEQVKHTALLKAQEPKLTPAQRFNHNSAQKREDDAIAEDLALKDLLDHA